MGYVVALSLSMVCLVGCSSKPTKPPLPTVEELRAKAGVTQSEWDEMMLPLKEFQGSGAIRAPANVEFLAPGVLTVYVADVSISGDWPLGEIRFHRENGKWIAKINILSEADRKRGRFVSIQEFELLLIKNEEQLRQEIALSGKSTSIDFTFEEYVVDEKRRDSVHVGRRSRLPSIRGWRYLREKMGYEDEVFVIHSPRETVVALKIQGYFCYVISGAFDYTHVYLPEGFTDRAKADREAESRADVLPVTP